MSGSGVSSRSRPCPAQTLVNLSLVSRSGLFGNLTRAGDARKSEARTTRSQMRNCRMVVLFFNREMSTRCSMASGSSSSELDSLSTPPISFASDGFSEETSKSFLFRPKDNRLLSSAFSNCSNFRLTQSELNHIYSKYFDSESSR